MKLRRVWALAAASAATQMRWRPHARPGLRFLCYHSVVPRRSEPISQTKLAIFADTLRDHVQVLRHRGFQLVSMAAALRMIASGNLNTTATACLTFDDGYADNAEVAWPILRDLQCPAHFFVSAGNIGRNSVDRYATAAQLREMATEGASIGCHGYTHTDLRGRSPSELSREIGAARLEIERALRLRVDTFAYPYGAFDVRAIDAVHAAGFRAAFIVRLGAVCSSVQNAWTVPRTLVEHDEDLRMFDLKVCGGFDWVGRYSAARQWLGQRHAYAAGTVDTV